MGIEVPHDDGIILMGAEEDVQVGPVPCWAAGNWGDVDVDDVELNVINCESDSLALNDGVNREKLREVWGVIGDFPPKEIPSGGSQEYFLKVFSPVITEVGGCRRMKSCSVSCVK